MNFNRDIGGNILCKAAVASRNTLPLVGLPKPKTKKKIRQIATVIKLDVVIWRKIHNFLKRARSSKPETEILAEKLSSWMFKFFNQDS